VVLLRHYQKVFLPIAGVIGFRSETLAEVGFCYMAFVSADIYRFMAEQLRNVCIMPGLDSDGPVPELRQ